MTCRVIDRMQPSSNDDRRRMARSHKGNDMNRRKFVALAAGTLATGALTGIPSAMGATAEAGGTLDAAAYRAARRLLDTAFGKIAYVERGSGDAALFLHGFPLNGFQWRGAIERLSPHRRCVAPDFMGLGYTQVAEGQSVAPAAQVEMLAALLDKLSIATVDIVASDSGGQVAQLFVVKYPQRVRTLLLANGDVEIDSPPPAVMPVIELSRQGKIGRASCRERVSCCV